MAMNAALDSTEICDRDEYGFIWRKATIRHITSLFSFSFAQKKIYLENDFRIYTDSPRRGTISGRIDSIFLICSSKSVAFSNGVR